MKLAALALARADKKLTIKTGEDQWSFELTEDVRFGSRRCLFVTMDKRAGPASDHEWTEIRIEGLCNSDWHLCRPRFLDLVPDNFPMVDTPAGRFILGNKTRGALFVRGIFVNEKQDLKHYGYDLLDITLDRDRKAATSRKSLYQKTANILAYCLNNNGNLCRDPQLPANTRELLRALPRDVYDLVKASNEDWMQPLAPLLDASVATTWFEFFSGESPGKQPTDDMHHNNKYAMSFHDEFVQVQFYMHQVLSRAPTYKSLAQLAEAQKEKLLQQQLRAVQEAMKGTATLGGAAKEKKERLEKVLQKLYGAQHRVVVLKDPAKTLANILPALAPATKTAYFAMPFNMPLHKLLKECITLKRLHGEDLKADELCEKLNAIMPHMDRKRKRDDDSEDEGPEGSTSSPITLE